MKKHICTLPKGFKCPHSSCSGESDGRFGFKITIKCIWLKESEVKNEQIRTN